MKNSFIPYEEALALKELGFDGECLAFYNGSHLDFDIWDTELHAVGEERRVTKCCSAPLYQQAFRWFREEHKLFAQVGQNHSRENLWGVTIETVEENRNRATHIDYFCFDVDKTKDSHCTSYEEAEFVGLKELIKIVRQREQ